MLNVTTDGLVITLTLDDDAATFIVNALRRLRDDGGASTVARDRAAAYVGTIEAARS